MIISKHNVLIFIRTLVLVLFCSLLFINASSNSKNNSHNNIIVSDSSDYYVELKGIVRQSKGKELEDTKALDSALITIYVNDIPYSEIWTNKKGKCIFRLSFDKIYKIEVSKNGFVTKFFEVDTKVPVNKRDAFTFNFDIDIFEYVKGLNVSVLKKPIAKVAFSRFEEQFAYDTHYTSTINAELKKMYKEYYMLQKIDLDLAH